MKNWSTVWREGLAHLLSTAGLEALERGLRRDEPAIMQGATTAPRRFSAWRIGRWRRRA
jgi:hypothetical protein